MTKLGRSKEKLTYHGRSGYPVIHETTKGKRFIMVRKRGGGVKRLYLTATTLRQLKSKKGK
jgi:hypothetical protein